MQGPGLPIEAETVPVVEAIGGVGILLDFEQQAAGTNGMDSTAGRMEDHARARGETLQ